ncbi:hypothetical protein Hanom_Chr16g01461641 [Helianthus anomalus]
MAIMALSSLLQICDGVEWSGHWRQRWWMAFRLVSFMFVDIISPLYVSFIFIDLGFLCIFRICKVIICVVSDL